jgi:hypothetical protein
MSKARCNMAKILPKRRKTLNISKTYSVAIPKGNAVARVAAVIP